MSIVTWKPDPAQEAGAGIIHHEFGGHPAELVEHQIVGEDSVAAITLFNLPQDGKTQG